MRKSLSLLLGAALIAGTPAFAAKESGEAQLAKAIDGRVAGEPVSCIDLHRVRSSRVIDGTAIVYEAAGGKLYVNRPDSGANSLSRHDVLVTRSFSNRLCDVDVVELRDRGGGMMSGLVFLGEFVPYSKADKD